MKKGQGMTPQKALEIFPDERITKLKKLRVEKGYSQQDLADVSGVAKRAILTYEHRKTNLDKVQLETLCKLAQALNCRVGDLLEDEELLKLYQKCR